MKSSRRMGLIVVCLFLLVADRLLKIAAVHGLLDGSFFGFGYPRLALHRNPGIAFDIPLPMLLTILVSAAILVVFMVFLVQALHHRAPSAAAFIFLIAGATSNLYDRLRFGAVIDVIEIVPHSIWNIADGMILIGLALLLLREPKK